MGDRSRPGRLRSRPRRCTRPGGWSGSRRGRRGCEGSCGRRSAQGAARASASRGHGRFSWSLRSGLPGQVLSAGPGARINAVSGQIRDSPAVITRLTGTLEAVDDRAAAVAVGGGLVYEVLVPAFLAERLKGQVGGAVTLTTFQYL